MRFRVPNIAIRYADEIFSSNNLIETIEKILEEEYIRKILFFNNSSIMKEWEKDKSAGIAESIAKYIIRMASRTTINQLFGVIVADDAKESEEYFLSREYIREFIISKISENYNNKFICYKLGNLVKNEIDRYCIYTYMNGTRKLLVIQKKTVVGKLLSLIDNKEVSSDKIYDFMKSNGISENIAKKIIKDFIINRIIVTNFDLEDNIFEKSLLSGEIIRLLDDNEIKKIAKLENKIDNLSTMELDEYTESLESINSIADKLLGKNIQFRIVTGYSKKKLDFPSDKAFNMGKRMKSFFTALGSIEPSYIKLKKFESMFQEKYGLFQAVSFHKSLKLYREINNTDSKDKRSEEILEWFESKVNEVSEFNEKEVVLSDNDVDEIIEKCGNIKRDRREIFDFKYERCGKDVIATDISFTYHNALFQAYLNGNELSDNEESDCVYYCPRYLQDIGYVRGKIKRKLRLDSFNKKETDIKNMLLVADYSGIHIIDENSGNEILPVNPTMKGFGYQIECDAIEFLDMFGKYKSKLPSTRIPVEFERHSIIPRVRYRNVIISPKKWIIKTDKILSLGIDEAFKKYNIDRYVYWINETGEKKYLDLSSSLSKKWLKSYSKTHTYIILAEMWKDAQFTECIIDIKFEKEMEKAYYNFYKETPVQLSKSKYLSWHIFYNAEKLEIIKSKLYEYLTSSNYRYFFIYYIEDGSNVIRLRIKEDVFESTYKFMYELKDSSTIINFKLSTYEPETVRYGGITYINEIETLFEKEAEAAIKLVTNLDRQALIIRQVAVISSMLENTLEFNKRKEFIKRYSKYSEESKLFYKRNKAIILKDIKTYNESTGVETKYIDNKIKIILEKISRENDEIYVWYILSSLIHMRLNRFTGISKENERLSFDILQYYYKEIK
ncbi:MAG: thiopeptide-type bacteriocin biosynthesis protein [Peptoanaerobacter stomatis]|uniref:thiopeptide-type bacteriocin biosynthesis protein n=1 Tax=Peptoanaerobacter stomatis TaxID=796937 RepID=UPI003FA018E5